MWWLKKRVATTDLTPFIASYVMNIRASLSSHQDDLLVAAAEIYLLLPVLLWVAAWFIPAISLPVCLGLLFVLFRHLRTPSRRERAGELRSLDLRSVFVCVVLAAAFTFLIGFDGRTNQATDLTVRNALYAELIQSPWPLVLPNGDFVVYSLQYWLPPALFSSWFPHWQVEAIQVWHFTGLLVAFLLLCRNMGTRQLLFLLSLLVLIVPLGTKFDVTGLLYGMCPCMADIIQTYHFFVTTLILLALYQHPGVAYPRLLFCAALLFTCAPLPSLFFAPIMLWELVRYLRQTDVTSPRKKLLMMPELYAGVVLVVCAILYFRSGTGTMIVDVLTASLSTQKTFQESVQFIVCGYILLQVQPYIIYMLTKEKILLYVMGYGTFCYAVCFTGDCVINEALFKFTLPYTFFCAWCLVKHFRQTQVRIATIALLLLSLPWVVGMLAVDKNWKNLPQAFRDGFSVQAKNIRNEWGGTLYYPSDERYAKLVSDSVPAPWLYRCSERSNCHQESPQKP